MINLGLFSPLPESLSRSHSSFLFHLSLLFSLLRPLFSASFSFHHPILASCRRFFFLPHNPRTCTADKCFKSVIKIKKVCKASFMFKRQAKTCLSSPSGPRLFGRPRWPLWGENRKRMFYWEVLEDRCDHKSRFLSPETPSIDGYLPLYAEGHFAHWIKVSLGKSGSSALALGIKKYYCKSPISTYAHLMKTTHSR